GRALHLVSAAAAGEHDRSAESRAQLLPRAVIAVSASPGSPGWQKLEIGPTPLWKSPGGAGARGGASKNLTPATRSRSCPSAIGGSASRRRAALRRCDPCRRCDSEAASPAVSVC